MVFLNTGFFATMYGLGDRDQKLSFGWFFAKIN